MSTSFSAKKSKIKFKKGKALHPNPIMILVDVRENAIDQTYTSGFLPPDFRSFITCSSHRFGKTVNDAELRAYWRREENVDYLRDPAKLEKVRAASILLAYLYLATICTSSKKGGMYICCNSILNYGVTFDVALIGSHGVGMPMNSQMICVSACEAIIGGPAGIVRWMNVVVSPNMLDEAIPDIRKEENENQQQKLFFCDHSWFMWMYLPQSEPLRRAFANYANQKGMPFKPLRFSLLRDGRPLYLSEIGNKTIEEVGLVGGDVITTEIIKQPTNDYKPATVTKPRGDKKSRSKKKMKQQKKKKKKNCATQYQPATDDSSHRIEHSKSLSLVFEEADATFKLIRQKLNSLDLQRTPPKTPTTVNLPSPSVDTGERQSSFDPEPQSSKAGKIFYDVRVGEVASLYKTSKPNRKNKFDRAASIDIDLNGCTRDEGRAKLDSSLPGWLRMAMEGSYPWVIRVRIVCGGGSQILSEMVEGWIREHENVANSISW